MTELVLSCFPGVGLLDRAFTAAGFCVVQAQDKITGGDIRDFAGVRGRLDGIVAGPPPTNKLAVAARCDGRSRTCRYVGGA